MKKKKIYEINRKTRRAVDSYLDYGIINTPTHKQISLWEKV